MRFSIAAAVFLVAVIVAVTQHAHADANGTDFESFMPGSINGQNGWRALGAAGGGCAAYDEGVASSSGTIGFGSQSFRISNAVTSGCFGDQAFSAALTTAAGETTAQTSTFSSAIREPHFEAQFDIASALPNAQQPGLSISVSPDRGDGGRMSYLRFEDRANGIHAFFDDYQDVAPQGTLASPANGCGVGDNFIETDVATLDRSVPHTIKFSMDFLEGPANDIVKIYIDGTLVHTGTSWEDYYRWCTESGGGVVNNAAADVSRTVGSLLFRAGGTAVPANRGKGFLIDSISYFSGLPPAPPPPPSPPTPPPSPSLSSGSGGGSPPSSAYFYGQAYPGGTIKIFRKSAVTGPYESIPLTSISVASDGTFQATIQNFLQASYFFAIQAVDKNGLESQVVPLISQFVPSGNGLILKNILIPPTIELVSSVVLSGQPVKVSGYAAPSSTVEAWVDGGLIGQTISDPSGFYAFTTGTLPLPLAGHAIKTRFILSSGAKSDFSLEKTLTVSTLAFPKMDLNGDAVVNSSDLSIFLFRWASTDATLKASIDFNGDGKVDVSDFSILLNAIRLQ